MHLMKRLWSDDAGAIMATEIAFMMTLLTVGTVGGLVALRQAVISETTEVAQAILALNQSYSFSGTSIQGCAMTGGSSASDSTNTISAASSAALAAAINQAPCD